ncbi:MAG: polymer-forming cytoskeletal protein [Amylibacter sp.]|nr:polymer-forming cytoskeletal protein [Amylibacter sp.]
MFSKKPEQPKPSNIPNTALEKPLNAALSPSSSLNPALSVPKAKPPSSTLSTDLHIKGNMKTTGDIQISGTVDGDIRAHLLTVGEGSTVKGEIVADDIVVHGRVIGRVRGLKVRLTATARVEGDIIHKTIAIESGAHFEGSVTRQDDPLNSSAAKIKSPSKPIE